MAISIFFPATTRAHVIAPDVITLSLLGGIIG